MLEWMQQHVDAHVAAAAGVGGMLAEVHAVGELLCAAFAAGGVVYTFGNGGSAADAQHLAGELIGHYKRDRRPLPAVTLTSDATVMTCIANDYAYDDVFSRQVTALARPDDVVIGFTTSGRSPNVVSGPAAARTDGAATGPFRGRGGGAGRADERRDDGPVRRRRRRARPRPRRPAAARALDADPPDPGDAHPDAAR